jgi:thiamine-monophosphate kinase
MTRALAPEENLRDREALRLALHGGDEYELLFTADPQRRIPARIAGVPVTRIGEITRGRQIKLLRSGGKAEPLKPAGWEHFQ